jgi:N-acetylneuraminic acid mutarotase
MVEQPLSAALLVVDVPDPDLRGDCHNPDDRVGPPPCDIRVWATGLRNLYDFTLHSNGLLYGADNGLGVTGTYPPTADPPCTELGDASLHNPGSQPDLLLVIEEGRYYGHPNPSRAECVYQDGSYQDATPLPSYQAPIFNLGDHKSANGIVEYTHESFCGALRGELLLANYAVGDDLTRVRLSEDGRSVQAASSLVGGFDDPLPLALGPDGTIWVGEFDGDQVTALVPEDFGCWASAEPLPEAILDAGSAALDGKLWVVAGKTSEGHVSSVYAYDPRAGTWSVGPALPGPAVENPAVVAHAGRLWVFGGSTGPFSGAVDRAAVLDPGTGTWTALAPLSVARGGATARVLAGRIYVIGGMDASGRSVDVVEVYDPASDAWSPAAPLLVRRDNPGSAVLDGKLYVFGGRTRNADGSAINATLASVEMYDPATDAWRPRASMPTGRRTMSVGTLGGRVQLMGGENAPDGGAFSANEEYDPVSDSWRVLRTMPAPRHGAAAGTIGGVVYVTGGGPRAGTAFTASTDVFTFQ